MGQVQLHQHWWENESERAKTATPWTKTTGSSTKEREKRRRALGGNQPPNANKAGKKQAFISENYSCFWRSGELGSISGLIWRSYLVIWGKSPLLTPMTHKLQSSAPAEHRPQLGKCHGEEARRADITVGGRQSSEQRFGFTADGRTKRKRALIRAPHRCRFYLKGASF